MMFRRPNDIKKETISTEFNQEEGNAKKRGVREDGNTKNE